MTNKQYIKNFIIQDNKKNNVNTKLGIYSDILDQASKRTINRLLSRYGDYGDIKATIQGKRYIIELSFVMFDKHNEVDFRALTEADYKSRYGSLPTH